MRDTGTRSVCTAALRLAAVAAVGWVCLHWLLPWFLPLLVAFLLAAAIEPAVRALEARLQLPRGVGAALCSIALLGTLLILLVLLGCGAMSQLRALADRMPELFQSIRLQVQTLEARLLAYLNAADSGLADYVAASLAAIYDRLTALPAALSQQLVTLLSAAAGKAPSMLLFTVTCGIGTYLFSAAYPAVLHFLRLQIPALWRSRAAMVWHDLRHTLSRWLKAQCMMSMITFAALFLAFLLLRLPDAALLALLIALIDALPILGSGIVLLPWALISALTGAYGLCVGLLSTYGAVTLLHSCLQAKLVGDQLGLHPLVSLGSIYIGWCVAGIWGLLLAPVAAITLKQLHDRGIIRLWKEESH